MTARRVWRATAIYTADWQVVRHFLTNRAAQAWAGRRRAGWGAEMSFDGQDEMRMAMPPAVSVLVEASEPVVFQP